MEGKLVRYQQPQSPIDSRIARLKQRMGDAIAALTEAEARVEQTERSIQELQEMQSGPEESAPRVYVETIETLPVIETIDVTPATPRKKRIKPLTDRAIEQLENLHRGAKPETVAPHTLKALRERGMIDAQNKVTPAGVDLLRTRSSAERMVRLA